MVLEFDQKSSKNKERLELILEVGSLNIKSVYKGRDMCMNIFILHVFAYCLPTSFTTSVLKFLKTFSTHSYKVMIPMFCALLRYMMDNILNANNSIIIIEVLM